jgi:hypothetical protein
MSETEVIERDGKGRFINGAKPGPGRPVGSRNRLADAFVSDLRDCWEIHGVKALEKCATQEPATFVKVIASLMPRDVNLNVGVDATTFVATFRAAQAMLGNDRPPPKIIDAR